MDGPSKAAFADRRHALECERRVKQFWLELDERVHPGLVGGEQQRALGRVGQCLFNRLEARIVAGRAGRLPHFAREATSPRTRRALAWVSALFRSVHAHHLVLPRGTDLLAWALEQFATGAAATFHGDPAVHERLALHGVPDSSEFLKLPELGFACVDHRIDAPFWSAHLGALTLAARLFLANADTPAAGTAKLAGSGAFDHRAGRQLGATERRTQHALHAAACAAGAHGAESAFTELLATTFVDVERLGPDTSPTPPGDGRAPGALNPRPTAAY